MAKRECGCGHSHKPPKKHSLIIPILFGSAVIGCISMAVGIACLVKYLS